VEGQELGLHEDSRYASSLTSRPATSREPLLPTRSPVRG